jgi:lysyl-tRNA synthetase, class I
MAKKSQKLFHWTDVAAENILRIKGKKTFVVESGITPSGFIHLGNFREAITADLVRKGLERAGHKVKYYYVWDDYDVLRKIPKNVPQAKLQKHLRKPVFKVPDPYDCHDSYAQHFEKVFEEELSWVGIDCEFHYQHKRYDNGDFVEEIKLALEHTKEIKEILNQYRKEPLAADWLPIFVFCEKCDKDTITTLSWKSGYDISYACECGHAATIDYRQQHNVTLRWRVDWPMRWHKNKVDFESAGKDHYASGGSVDTGKQIQNVVYHTQPPFGFPYEWIGIKGKGQFASSLGNVVTLTEMLEIYEPSIVRYLFAGTRPNREFSISFDTDVLALYEEYDKVERIYYDLEKVNEKDTAKAKVAYELSTLGKIPKKILYQPGFRHLTMLLQIHNLEVSKVIDYFSKQLKNQNDRSRLRSRAECAKNWVQKHAPTEFKFKVQEKCQVTLVKADKTILQELSTQLESRDWTDVELHEEIYVLCTNHEFPAKDFFKLAYRVLINQDKGPRLASFILAIGKEKVAKLFNFR